MASVATAGPNAGGVLWVHDTGIEFSSDLALPPASTPPADCAGVDNQQDVDGIERVWKVYAAFPPGSHPRLKTCGWAIQFPEAATSAYSYVNVPAAGPRTRTARAPTSTSGTSGSRPPVAARSGRASPPAPGPPPWSRSSTSTASATTPAARFRPGARRRTALPATVSSVMTRSRPMRTRSWATAPWASAPRHDPVPDHDPDAACCAPSGACSMTTQINCHGPERLARGLARLRAQSHARRFHRPGWRHLRQRVRPPGPTLHRHRHHGRLQQRLRRGVPLQRLDLSGRSVCLHCRREWRHQGRPLLQQLRHQGLCLRNAERPVNPIACNDDYYFAAPCYTYSSYLAFVSVAGRPHLLHRG